MSIKPTLSVPLFGGEVTMHAFGREHGCNFSFQGIDGSENAFETHKAVFEALASIPANTDFFAPSPAKMNAKVVTPSGVTARIWKHQKQSGGKLVLYRGADADGLSYLHPWASYVMSAADCALIVARCGNKVAAAHAGRNSIIDMDRIKGGNGREHESVVDALCLYAFEPSERKNLEVWIGFSISAGPHFEHSMFDEQNPHNDRLVRYICNVYGPQCFKDDGQGRSLGWLDTKELIRRQFVRYGVRERNISLHPMCTYSDQKDGEYVWYSNKRQLVAGEEQRRNLVAVVVNR